jgi:hypothetical protein
MWVMAAQDGMTVKTAEAGEIPVRSPRVAAMILFLVNNERKIGRISKGQLLFGFAGATSLTADLNEREDLTRR